MLSLIKKTLNNKGLQIRKVSIKNYRDKKTNPLNILYNTSADRVLLSIPIEKCRTQLWNTLEAHKNPFVQTLNEYKNDEINSYEGSALEQYYNSNQPISAGEVLRIPNNPYLENLPALDFVLPWDFRNSRELKEIRDKNARNENSKNQFHKGIEAGYSEFGPVTKEKGEIEFKRLKQVFTSIKQNGYTEKTWLNDGFINGFFLCDQTEWCFIIKSGKHRSYALAALGSQEIPVVVDRNLELIQDKSNSSFWEKIVNNKFTKQDIDLFYKKILNV